MDFNGEGKLTILDEYDCSVFDDRIRVTIDSPRDPSLSDIMSELYASNGHAYFDGSYYNYYGSYNIFNDEDFVWYLDLFVS